MNYAAVSAANYMSLPFGDGYTAHVTGSYGDQDDSHFALLDRDADTSTEHAQFRQYGESQGQWMSPDPYTGSYDLGNPQSFNRYTYGLNNPLTFLGHVQYRYTDANDSAARVPQSNACHPATAGLLTMAKGNDEAQPPIDLLRPYEVERPRLFEQKSTIARSWRITLSRECLACMLHSRAWA